MSKENSLARTHPEIAEDWVSDVSGLLSPRQVTIGYRGKVLWRCSAGHEYEVSVYSRVRSNGCKICQRQMHVEKSRLTRLKKSRTLAEALPHLVPEWIAELNAPLTPETISFKSHKKVWWKCEKSHEWQAAPHWRARGDGCPTCGKKKAGERRRKAAVKKAGQSFAESYPEILKEWNYQKNRVNPTEIAPKSNYRAHWICKYGHKWEQTVTNRTHNMSNCPECNPQASRIEIYILCELRAVFEDVEWRRKFDGFECDIYIPEYKIGIEVDGQYWHDSKLSKDIEKTAFLSEMGVNLLRVRDARLPAIEGPTVTFGPQENLQEVLLRLLLLISEEITTDKLEEYLSNGTQQNGVSFREIVARLPAPPEGKTLKDLHPQIASEWDYEKNFPLVPELFGPSSNQKVWWACEHGHKWDASINNRVNKKSGCRFCYEKNRADLTRKAFAQKTISLEQGNPDYLPMYDNEKNGFPPSEVAFKSSLSIWWRCKNGHNFQRKPSDMAKNSQCPGCNSLTYKYPEIAREWDHERNGDKRPDDYTWASGVKIWWKCSNGHSFETPISQRTSAGTGCLQCYNESRSGIYRKASLKKRGSLADHNPPYLSEWDYENNQGISPQTVTLGSKINVWWLCPNNHSYQQTIESKTKGANCPECTKIIRAEKTRKSRLARTGSLVDKYPEIAKLWHPQKNNGLLPSEISGGSKRVVWWQCGNGHEWKRSIGSMTDNRRYCGCLICRDREKKTKR